MRYFLTGATGFLGGRIARQLRDAGHEVVALVRSPGKAAALRELGVEIAAGDVTEEATLRAPMTGADGVFHVAGWYKVGVRDTSPAVRINVEGTRNVLAAMRDLGIPKGVYTSTLAVNSDTGGRLVDERYHFHGRHLSVYDQTKAEAHAVADEMIRSGLPLVVVQPGLIYGPGDQGPTHDAWVQYLTGKMPLVPRKTAFSWAHVDDVARAHLLAMARGKPGESYLTCGPTHTFEEGMAIAEEATGVRAPRFRPGPGVMKAMAAFMGVVGKVVPVPAHLSGESIRIVAGVTYIGDNTKARRDLGWEPRPLSDGLPEALRWEMEQLGMERKAV